MQVDLHDNQAERITVAADPLAAVDPASAAVAPNWANTCEIFIKRILANRFIWLVFGCALYCNIQLTYIQLVTAKHGAPQFDTLDLMAHLLAVVEAAALATVMLGLGAVGSYQALWRKRYPSCPFPYLAYTCALQLVTAMMLFAQLAFLIYPHSYPQLREEGISIPLMLLQRTILIYLALSVSIQLAWITRVYFKAPWGLVGAVSFACQLALGTAACALSLKFAPLLRLNSVFYAGYAWRYLPAIPNLQHSNLFHNIGMPYFGYYVMIGALLVIFLSLLWLPRASLIARRETHISPTESSS